MLKTKVAPRYALWVEMRRWKAFMQILRIHSYWMLEHDPPVMWRKAEQSMLPIKNARSNGLVQTLKNLRTPHFPIREKNTAETDIVASRSLSCLLDRRLRELQNMSRYIYKKRLASRRRHVKKVKRRYVRCGTDPCSGRQQNVE